MNKCLIGLYFLETTTTSLTFLGKLAKAFKVLNYKMILVLQKQNNTHAKANTTQ
jgi:hypothetical protein